MDKLSRNDIYEALNRELGFYQNFEYMNLCEKGISKDYREICAEYFQNFIEEHDSKNLA